MGEDWLTLLLAVVSSYKATHQSLHHGLVCMQNVL